MSGRRIDLAMGGNVEYFGCRKDDREKITDSFLFLLLPSPRHFKRKVSITSIQCTTYNAGIVKPGL